LTDVKAEGNHLLHDDCMTPDLVTALEIPERSVLRAFDINGPRYTSYPTADRFVESFDAARWTLHANAPRPGAVKPRDRGVSVYVHVPFCPDVCFYCACNKIVTRDPAKIERYLGYLEREIAARGAVARERGKVARVHFGGGTPNVLSEPQFKRILVALKQAFEVDAEPELSIEIDPRVTSTAQLAMLAQLGFVRLSMGVQDFDPDVQKSIRRIQPEEMTAAALRDARSFGFRSINIDLIHGLPRQTLASYERTIERTLALAPDRIATFGYAHLPARFPAQRRIVDAELPTAEARLDMQCLALVRCTQAGYVALGMDHYARPDDSLAVAFRHGVMQRNFQGYDTHASSELIGVGVSAISATPLSYSQNHRSLDDYYSAIDADEIPVARGIELGADDLLRRDIIASLMCRFVVDKSAIEESHLVDFDTHFAVEIDALAPHVKAGLVMLTPEAIEVTARGRWLVRVIAMVFDRHLQSTAGMHRYSRVM
jgi:oxygen-independent coproporphyrinogen III oxidase